ncbi:MAG: hypothetical protein ACYCYR_03170 [Desulfobulbaceae bacterium]
MALYDSEFPENGYSLVYYRGGKVVNATALAMLKTDWGIVWQVWPFIELGFLIGMAAGYPLGEVARRKYAIDRASREAVLQGEALRDEADRKLLCVENTLREAYAQEARVKIMQEKLSVEQHEVYAMQMTAQTQMMEVAALEKGVDYLQKELANAKAKIQKLKRRGPQKPKPVDFGPRTG